MKRGENGENAEKIKRGGEGGRTGERNEGGNEDAWVRGTRGYHRRLYIRTSVPSPQQAPDLPSHTHTHARTHTRTHTHTHAHTHTHTHAHTQKALLEDELTHRGAIILPSAARCSSSINPLSPSPPFSPMTPAILHLLPPSLPPPLPLSPP